MDAAGNRHSLSLALDTVARQGQITKIGWGPEPVDLSLDPLLRKAARLQGTFSHNWATWEAVMSMIAQGMIAMEPMLTDKVKLNQWLETFESLEKGQGVKAVFLFNE